MDATIRERSINNSIGDYMREHWLRHRSRLQSEDRNVMMKSEPATTAQKATGPSRIVVAGLAIAGILAVLPLIAFVVLASSAGIFR